MGPFRVAARTLHAPHLEHRRALLARQLEELREGDVTDFGASFRVFPDPQLPGGVWSAVKAGWRACLDDARATHVMLLEDDFVPSRHFARAVQRSVQCFPEGPISVWTTGLRAARHYARRRWWTAYDGVTGGSMILPRRLAERFLAEVDATVVAPHWTNGLGDLRLHACLNLWRELVTFTPLPFHQHLDEGRSTYGYNTSSFRQRLWPGRDFDLDTLPLEALAEKPRVHEGSIWRFPDNFTAVLSEDAKQAHGWEDTRRQIFRRGGPFRATQRRPLRLRKPVEVTP